MALGLIDKIANFLIPVEDMAAAPEKSEMDGKGPLQDDERRSRLKVHSQQAGNMKLFVDLPAGFDDVQVYANYLRSNMAIVVNYQQVDDNTHQRMSDFLNGVCYVLGGSVHRISDQVVMYAYANVEVDKKIFAYSVPTYVRIKSEQ